MLKIAQQQYQKLEEIAFQNLVCEITRWMMSEFAAPEAMPFEQVRGSVEPIAAAAWRWGIRDGNLIRLHVYVSKVLGFDYLKHFPEVNKTLPDKALEDELKLNWFASWVGAVKAQADLTKK